MSNVAYLPEPTTPTRSEEPVPPVNLRNYRRRGARNMYVTTRPTTASEELLQEFAHDQRAAGRVPATVQQRVDLIRKLELSSGVPLTEITTRHLKSFLGREDITQATRLCYRAGFKAFFRFLHDEGIRDDDPAEKLPVVKVLRRHARPFTPEQIEAMLTSGAYRNTRVMIMLGYLQGFRVSQIARVHGRDIDLIHRTITTVGKNNKVSTFPLHPALQLVAQTMPRDDWWFPGREYSQGPHIRPTSVSGAVLAAKRRAGIVDPILTAHSLRHSYGTHLFENGVDIRVIQELMAHEDLSTTQIYVSVSEQQKRAGIQALPGVEMPTHSGRAPSGRHAPRSPQSPHE